MKIDADSNPMPAKSDYPKQTVQCLLFTIT